MYLSAIATWSIQFYRWTLMITMHNLYRDENDELPNLLSIFSRQQIEQLLADAIDRMTVGDIDKEIGKKFIEIVARTGYKHEPGAIAPSNIRQTLVHYAVDKDQLSCLADLFVIYDNCDVNYADGAGLTHLHAACLVWGCESVVRRLLEHGVADLNQIWPKTGDAPLHLALYHSGPDPPELLLRAGADPNLANEAGSTPLHIMCEKEDCPTLEAFFEICDERKERVLMDERDNEGRTPLEWAVAKLYPQMLEMLLDRGADPAKFVFPTVQQMSETCADFKQEWVESWRIKAAAGLLACVDKLEKRGYAMTYEDVLTVMRLFEEQEMFQRREEPAEYSEEFLEKAKTIKHGKISFHDLLKLEPHGTRRPLPLEDYETVATDLAFRDLPRGECVDASSLHVVEQIAKPTFVKWSEEELYHVLQQRLQIELSAMVLQNMSNADMYSVCLAAKAEREEIARAMQRIARLEEPRRRSQRTRRAPDRFQVTW
ncbi:hypothetical protein TKK_0000770 [Trichogramma kaykai]